MTTPRVAVRTVSALALSCHPLPTVAVTTMVTALVIAAGNTWTVTFLAAVAVLTGQLSIGWCNDLIDATRDATVRRTDKPIAAGDISRQPVMIATTAAVALTTALSLALGWRSGLVHLSGVACGWLYNVWFKSTPLSPLPFFVAFGGLPAVATLARPDHPWPPAWAIVAGGLIGVAAHFGNVLPDLDEDARTDIRGLPHRLGAFVAAGTATGLAFVATLIAALGTGDAAGTLTWVAVAAAALLCLASFTVVRRDTASEAAFLATMAIAAIGIALIAASGSLT